MTRFSPRIQSRWLVLLGVLIAISLAGFASNSGFANPRSAPAGWQYRSVEAAPTALQAALDDLGRDGWEVVSVYGASTLVNDSNTLKQVPHTFYIFAKKPSGL